MRFPIEHWVGSHDPKKYTEYEKLTLTRPLFVLLNKMCLDDDRQPTPAELDRLALWISSWDWSEDDTKYDNLLVYLFFKEPFNHWLNTIARTNPFLDFKLALYSALRLDEFSQIVVLPTHGTKEVTMAATTHNIHNTLLANWLNYARALHPSYFASDTLPSASFVEHVFAKGVDKHLLNSTQCKRANTTRTVLTTLDNEPSAPEVLSVMIQSIEHPWNSPLVLPDDLQNIQ